MYGGAKEVYGRMAVGCIDPLGRGGYEANRAITNIMLMIGRCEGGERRDDGGWLGGWMLDGWALGGELFPQHQPYECIRGDECNIVHTDRRPSH